MALKEALAKQEGVVDKAKPKIEHKGNSVDINRIYEYFRKRK